MRPATDHPARELVRDVLGNAADDLTDRQCGRILCAMFATADRELKRTRATTTRSSSTRGMKREPRVKH